MNSYMHTVSRLAKLLTKAFFRDKIALFFTLIFPLIFLLVFGSLNRNNRGVSFDISIINTSTTDFSKDFGNQLKQNDFVEVDEEVIDLNSARELMSQGELDTILYLPQDFGQPNDKSQPAGKAEVYFDPSNPQTGQTFASITESILGEIDQQLTGQQPLFNVEQKSTDTRGLSSFDYIFAGLLGFSILSLGFFGPTNSIPSMKKEGILRRLRTTPIRTSQYVIGTAVSYLVAGLTSIALLFVVGVLMFDFQMQGDYLSFVALVLSGTTLMFGFGLAIGGWAKNENQAAPLANLMAFPMMFLSGTFFPRFLMPEWLQSISAALPLTPLVDGIRFIIVEGQTLMDIGPQLALIAGWLVVVYVVAFRVFRWE